MKKNIYTNGISKIKAPDEVVNRGIESIRNTEITENIISFEKVKAKRKWFKPLGAVASVLAVVIALGAVGVWSGTGSDNGNSFILTANAEELNSETFVKVGDLDMRNESAAWRQTKDGWEIMYLGGEFNLNIVCTGEDIESVTYTTQSGYFVVDWSDEGLLDYQTFTLEEIQNLGISTNGYDSKASSCTFAYDKQPASRLDYEITEDDVIDGSIPLTIAFNLEENVNNTYQSDIEKYGKHSENAVSTDINTGVLFADIFNNNEKIYSVDITANYTDGSTKTETLQLKCEQEENKTFLSAKIV